MNVNRIFPARIVIGRGEREAEKIAWSSQIDQRRDDNDFRIIDFSTGDLNLASSGNGTMQKFDN